MAPPGIAAEPAAGEVKGELPATTEAPTTNVPKHRFGFPKNLKEGVSLSHWLKTVQGDPLLDHRTTPDLPTSADIVIIGSGMTGSTVAKHCLATWPGKSVVILEARQFCSGATGRNAGHLKPDPWRAFTKYENLFGAEQALKILENELQTYANIMQYIQENNVDCDIWTGYSLDVPMTAELAEQARVNFERVKAAGGKVDLVKVAPTPEEAVKWTRIKDAQACYASPGSTVHPWKFTAHVMRDNIKKGANLQTHTQVNRVIRSPRDSARWNVETDRGVVECAQVVHATNGYSAAIEPSLRGLIRPQPHICNRVTPPASFSGDSKLKNSYGVFLNGMYSINPRTTSDGYVLFGGVNPGIPALDAWLNENPHRCTDDGLTEFESVTRAVRDLAENQLIGWTDGGPDTSELYSWSGILGLSADGLPFVGELPGLPGQFVCAGHNGQGMVRIFTATPGLVKLMGGSLWEELGLPDVYHATPERLERLRQRVTARPVWARV